MALVECKECGERVSTKAKTCPKCGVKAPKKTSIVTWLVLIFIIFVVYAASQNPTSSVSSSSSQLQGGQSSANIGKKLQNTQKAASHKPTWTQSTSKDEMTGKRSAYASSPIAIPTRKMGFPYSDTHAWLGVGFVLEADQRHDDAKFLCEFSSQSANAIKDSAVLARIDETDQSDADLY